MVASRCRAAVALFAVALLAGCSGEADGESTAATQTSQEADAGVVTWADGVCAATTDLEAAVQQVTPALQVDPAASGTALDQVKTEVAEGAGVQAHVASLKESAESRDPVLQNAFAEAPACQARQTRASPSS